MLPSRILVATDGSPSAVAAEAFAAELAVAEHASNIDIVTVALKLPVRGAVIPPSPMEIEAAERHVAEAAEHIRWMIGGEPILIEERVLDAAFVAEAIIREAYATDERSHIVMGSRGRGGLMAFLLGSISQETIRGAYCPVTIVRS